MADTVRVMKLARFGVVALVIAGAVLFGGSAVAQVGGNGPTINPVEQTGSEVAESEVVDFDKNQAGIDRARRTLLGIAVVMTVMLIAYWWHTIPSRRLRAANRRLADHRARTEAVDASSPPIERG